MSNGRASGDCRPDRSAIVFVLDDQGTTVQANPLGARMIEFAGGGTTPAERTELVEFRDEQGRVIPAAAGAPTHRGAHRLPRSGLRAAESHANGWLGQPFEYEDLEATVRRFVARPAR
jgi:hypothetical protein